ncbi:hypothetical protein PCANC_14860 [Puccinia coronata f. sp. avenae]|uniref:Uncharacterized protein n=1 Tax=Puccinia coronata f. sp. avenae TaxID=200324 RepID=A0A2N5UP50_9BASI|nr:hypothetical protein PCANC_14860 [Puccinia coronata f. sp. avenae]
MKTWAIRDGGIGKATAARWALPAVSFLRLYKYLSTYGFGKRKRNHNSRASQIHPSHG